jgi:hypothetical protein
LPEDSLNLPNWLDEPLITEAVYKEKEPVKQGFLQKSLNVIMDLLSSK